MSKLNSLKRLSCVISVCLTTLALPQLSRADEGPLFIGPLLAGPGETVPAGHFNLEPYLFITDYYGAYANNWHASSIPRDVATSPNIIISYGVNDWMDIQGSFPYVFKNSQGQAISDIGDMNVQLGFQVYKAKDNSWLPNARFTLTELFPTGNFEDLNSAKTGLDATGAGFYSTQFGLNFQKAYTLLPNHELSVRWNLAYTIPYRANVHSNNVYGGGVGTNGTLHGNRQFSTDLGLEYELTRHWAPALDVVYSVASPVTFSGTPGITSIGLPAATGAPGSSVFSVAPALEYNFNANLGVIGGVWVTIDGRNTGEYKAAVFAINYYI